MGKYGNGIKVSDGNGNGMGMGMKSLKWEGIGTKNLLPHTSTSDLPLLQIPYMNTEPGQRFYTR